VIEDERKQVKVLFSSLSRDTAMSEKRNLEVVRRIVGVPYSGELTGEWNWRRERRKRELR
jgi:hypothetical protein